MISKVFSTGDCKGRSSDKFWHNSSCLSMGDIMTPEGATLRFLFGDLEFRLSSSLTLDSGCRSLPVDDG